MNTKITSLPQLALAGAVALVTQITSGQNWQTVDDWAGSQARQAMFDLAGNLYVSGSSMLSKSSDGGTNWSTPGFDKGMGWPMTCDANGVLYATGDDGRWLAVFRSRDAGRTWSNVDPAHRDKLHGIAADAWGNVFTAGDARGPGWRVRKGTPNPDGSVTWRLVDSLASGSARSVVCHPKGIFVLGQLSETVIQKNKTCSQYVWLVRRSPDDGATWNTVDHYVCSGMPEALGVDPLGNIYAVGGGNNLDWLVRQSSDGGQTWTTVDDWVPDKGLFAHAYGVASDPAGNVFVVGDGLSGAARHWYVRMRPAGGTTWTTSDDFQHLSFARARGVISDSAGNVYVVGGAYDAPGTRHGLVRKLTRQLAASREAGSLKRQ